MDDITPEKINKFCPKNLFNSKITQKSTVIDLKKEEQKINIIGGKKRITPILLSPKKRFNTLVNKKRSSSPILSITIDESSNSDVDKVEEKS